MGFDKCALSKMHTVILGLTNINTESTSHIIVGIIKQDNKWVWELIVMAVVWWHEAKDHLLQVTTAMGSLYSQATPRPQVLNFFYLTAPLPTHRKLSNVTIKITATLL